MTLRQHHAPLNRLWTVWLALFVAVFIAAAPTLSHALAFAKGGSAGGIEICTTTGPRIVVLQSGALTDPAPAQDSARTLEHCALCLQTPDHAAPPAHAHTPVLRTTEGVLLGMVETGVAPSNTVYTRATPRGPPDLS
jgi:Protein of unknown function (DUF2946)